VKVMLDAGRCIRLFKPFIYKPFIFSGITVRPAPKHFGIVVAELLHFLLIAKLALHK